MLSVERLQVEINNEHIRYARKMLMGIAPPRDDIPCSVAIHYADYKKYNRWFTPAGDQDWHGSPPGRCLKIMNTDLLIINPAKARLDISTACQLRCVLCPTEENNGRAFLKKRDDGSFRIYRLS